MVVSTGIAWVHHLYNTGGDILKGVPYPPLPAPAAWDPWAFLHQLHITQPEGEGSAVLHSSHSIGCGDS